MKYVPNIHYAKLSIGLLLLAAVLMPKGVQTPATHLNAAAAVSGTVEAKSVTPEDYWKPWDNWLKAKGSPITGQDVWTAATDTHIKGEMLICITYAETNLGKVPQRGSRTNVGSVGSYDATNSTIPAQSVLHGLELIGQTLDNAQLGKKTTVAQLSRKSEPYGPIYAESGWNWETNVVGCLRDLTGRPVTNQWEFRT